MQELAASIYKLQRQRFHFVAGSSFYLSRKDNSYLTKLQLGNVICDSTPIAKFSNWISTKNNVKPIRGADFMRSALLISPDSTRHFFVGSSAHNLAVLESKIESNYPFVRIEGLFAPSYSESIELLIEEISVVLNQYKVDVVWLGLGSPKQDYLAYFLADRYAANFIAVGAAFDFISGLENECPVFLRESGLEWLYRLWRNPRRLWKRYFLGNLWLLFVLTTELVVSKTQKV